MVARVENETGVRIALRTVILSDLSEVAAEFLASKAKPQVKPGLVRRLLDIIK